MTKGNSILFEVIKAQEESPTFAQINLNPIWITKQQKSSILSVKIL